MTSSLALTLRQQISVATDNPPIYDWSSLYRWFQAEKRALPWRETGDPYAIWVSEVMLQQTQVAVVIPYFHRWMARFPTITALADAPIDEVIKLWEGLGYYARARHLHAAAQQIVAQFEGRFPSEERDLKTLKGLGPYTIGAILSFAFHQKRAAVDGNVLRVLSRYFGIEADIARPETVRQIRLLAQEILPAHEPWIATEALIELGALICQKKPRCAQCPVQQSCRAFEMGQAEYLPIKSQRQRIESLHRSVAVIQWGTHFLVRRGKPGGVMADLYEFPYIEAPIGGMTPIQLQENIREAYALTTTVEAILPCVTHHFTRYRASLYPVRLKSHSMSPVEGLEWQPHDHLEQLAFSAGHRRIWQQL